MKERERLSQTEPVYFVVHHVPHPPRTKKNPFVPPYGVSHGLFLAPPGKRKVPAGVGGLVRGAKSLPDGKAPHPPPKPLAPGIATAPFRRPHPPIMQRINWSCEAERQALCCSAKVPRSAGSPCTLRNRNITHVFRLALGGPPPQTPLGGIHAAGKALASVLAARAHPTFAAPATRTCRAARKASRHAACLPRPQPLHRRPAANLKPPAIPRSCSRESPGVWASALDLFHRFPYDVPVWSP